MFLCDEIFYVIQLMQLRDSVILTLCSPKCRYTKSGLESEIGKDNWN